ncbi:hypothetical protein [Cohaesibacter sp. ES.047]|uniref:hypothetical protein n=1 Tax=Cohaesibacter sp. ES.047 TaxID=1798205 RepID=UPI000BB85666|nr:hypothetical protein [Cohaesibacter sp. ES.047]
MEASVLRPDHLGQKRAGVNVGKGAEQKIVPIWELMCDFDTLLTNDKGAATEGQPFLSGPFAAMVSGSLLTCHSHQVAIKSCVFDLKIETSETIETADICGMRIHILSTTELAIHGTWALHRRAGESKSELKSMKGLLCASRSMKA